MSKSNKQLVIAGLAFATMLLGGCASSINSGFSGGHRLVTGHGYDECHKYDCGRWQRLQRTRGAMDNTVVVGTWQDGGYRRKYLIIEN